jgi:hypothetical protein
MPNHFHAIVIINDRVGVTGRSPLPGTPHGPAPKSLGALMADFKSSVTKQINVARDTSGASVWQRNYYEHIIRHEREMNAIWNYIKSNPSMWDNDATRLKQGDLANDPFCPYANRCISFRMLNANTATNCHSNNHDDAQPHARRRTRWMDSRLA